MIYFYLNNCPNPQFSVYWGFCSVQSLNVSPHGWPTLYTVPEPHGWPTLCIVPGHSVLTDEQTEQVIRSNIWLSGKPCRSSFAGIREQLWMCSRLHLERDASSPTSWRWRRSLTLLHQTHSWTHLCTEQWLWCSYAPELLCAQICRNLVRRQNASSIMTLPATMFSPQKSCRYIL